ncbi:MAG: type IV secretory system conjugative DNA transfer family protein [Planctomycetota bacterium]
MKKIAMPILVLVLAALGMIAGPTWMAHALANGRPIEWVAGPSFATVGIPLYHLGQVEQFGVKPPEAPVTYAIGFAITFGGLAIGVLIAMVSAVFAGPATEPMGRDKWMTTRGAKRAGLLADDGVICGRMSGTLLAFDGPEHHLIAGASRSGKGAGHVVPTLLCWSRSTLVYDVKGELWESTAGYRGALGDVLRFDPTDRAGACYNPLLEIRRGDHEVRDAQNVAEMLVNDGSKGGGHLGQADSIWDQEGTQLLTAMILHVLYAEPDGQKNLGRVRDLLMDIDETLRLMSETKHVELGGEPITHPEVDRVARHLLGTYDKFRESVRGTCTSKLALWADPIVRDVTSRSDFTAGDLVCRDRPLSLYLQPPPADQQRVRPLVRLMLHQLTRALMEDLKLGPLGREKKHRLLLVLDEFPTLGRMEFVSAGMRQMAGYGIKAMIVAQSFMDIQEHYGSNQTIVDNCHVLACFAAADTTTAQRISQMAGTVTEYRRSYGRSGRLDATRSINYSEQTRPLLSPGDVRELPYDEQLVFVTGHPPLRCRKVRYWLDRLLKPRLMPPPEEVDWTTSDAGFWTGILPAEAAPPLEDEADEDAPAPTSRQQAPAVAVAAATDGGSPDALDRFGDAMDEALATPDDDFGY